jgi:hypothetical protein
MAIPAFQKVRENSQRLACFNNQRQLVAAFDQYRPEKGAGAKTGDDVVGKGKFIATMPECTTQGTYSASHDKADGYTVTCSNHGKHRQAAAQPSVRTRRSRAERRTCPFSASSLRRRFSARVRRLSP